DREKLSFSERDRRRREGGASDRPAPRDQAGRERAAAATRQYLREIDGVFSKGEKNEIAELASAMRDAHGTPGLGDACRAYRAAAGLPEETALISLFLDAGDPELILAGYEALRAAQELGKLKVSGGLQSQLRILAEHPDVPVAEGAEDLLEGI
ncbi:MAG: hypothetical protein ACE5FL_09220, partial [Myxococcota bacterium]